MKHVWYGDSVVSEMMKWRFCASAGQEDQVHVRH
jgi:hypothetical protein